MKLAIPALTLALSALAAAQFDNQSAPFNLFLVSDNDDLNNQPLSACHEGAAIESLCLSNSISDSKTAAFAPSVFNFNTSDEVVTPNATLGAPGWLTYLLVGGNFEVSEALQLYIEPTTNVAHPQFFPGNQGATVLAFDSKDLLNIQGYVDDTQDPPVSGDTVAYYRWYACTTYYVGYTYHTVNWALGEAEPQNPTCEEVGVKRVFL